MLEKLKARLQGGGALTIAQLAREFDTTPALIAEMVAQLVRSGRVKQMGQGCDEVCGGCALVRNCRGLERSRLWQVSG